VLIAAAISRIPVVHLVRRNLLDAVISAKLALNSGVYHEATDGRPRIPWHAAEPRASKVRLEPSDLLRDLRRMRRERGMVRTWLRASRTRAIEVEYEALVKQPDRFGQILGFLGVSEREQLSSGLKKLRTAPRDKVVANIDEVRATLAGTSFEALLSA
jgi:LPS sulfotransferase NodH